MAFHQCTHSAASWSTSMPALGSTVIWRTRSSVSLWQYQIQIVKEGIFAFWNQVLDSSFYVVIWSSSLLPKSVISIWTSKAKEHLLSFTPIVQVTIGSRIATTGDIIFICMKKIICRVIWILLWFFVVFLFFFSILCLRLSGVWIQDNFYHKDLSMSALSLFWAMWACFYIGYNLLCKQLALIRNGKLELGGTRGFEMGD